MIKLSKVSIISIVFALLAATFYVSAAFAWDYAKDQTPTVLDTNGNDPVREVILQINPGDPVTSILVDSLRFCALENLDTPNGVTCVGDPVGVPILSGPLAPTLQDADGDGDIDLIVHFQPSSGTWGDVFTANLNGFNVARGKTSISVGPLGTQTHNLPASVLTDGKTVTDGYVGLNWPRLQNLGPQWIMLDLEAAYPVSRVNVRHYYGDGRTYHDVIVQLSEDGTTWNTIFNNDSDNTAGEGAGSDSEYAEIAAGNDLLLPIPTQARYVRAWSNGSTSNIYNHYVELEVYAQGPFTATRSCISGLVDNGNEPLHTLGSGPLCQMLVLVQPSIDIEKYVLGEDADTPPGPTVTVGDTLTFTYVVTNTSNVDLAGVTVTDDQGLLVTCPQTTLAVGEQMTCAAASTAVEGQHQNIGTATGTSNPGGIAVSDTDPANYTAVAPSIDIEKYVQGEDADTPPGPTVTVGDTLTFTYVVTNTGNVDLTDVTVTDNQGLVVTCPQTTLAVGEQMTCTATSTAVEGQHQNIGTATGTSNPGGFEVSDTDPANYIGALAAHPSIDIEKYVKAEVTPVQSDLCETFSKPKVLTMRYVGGGPGDSSHAQADGKVVVIGSTSALWVHIKATNKDNPLDSGAAVYFEGDVALGDTFVIDAALAGATTLGTDTRVHIFDPDTGIPLQFIKFHTSCSQPLRLGDQFGSIQLIGFVDKLGNSATLPAPTLGDDADDPPGPTVTVGDTLVFSYVVTNTGDVPLKDVTVTDDQGFAVTCPQTTLAVGEQMICTASASAQEGLHKNIGTATGVSDDAASTPVTDADPAHYTGAQEAEGGEGCTPGYWKQEHHFGSWVNYAPTDEYDVVFGVNSSFKPGMTLLQALKQGGGGEKALGRHAVAALLNASNPNVSYFYTEAQVIALVQQAYATGDFKGVKNLLEKQNEQGCPLGKSGHDDDDH